LNARTAASARLSFSLVRCEYAPSRCHLSAIEIKYHGRRKSKWRFNLRVEAVIPDHSEAFLREGALALEDMVEILRPDIYQ